ncbi:hypothetical protein [Roseinatronobacter sp. S2]|uniref:hypothetical protein n=1 Tax=Roseinatronobacter sp. S2 TaxID=3035471 RepID=UPI00240FCAC6|nr:hypothetical protein [Roseinatronobacter sp. S2]WFE73819.1 hypothetical protein P8S53_11575 [Roseinatronobacter sp. S2]
MSERVIAQLRMLLEDEKQALLGADFDSLSQLADRKEALIDALSVHPLRGKTLHELRTANARNQVLLAAIAKGVSAVRLTVLQHQKARNTSCYQKDGSQSPLLPQSGALARRA